MDVFELIKYRFIKHGLIFSCLFFLFTNISGQDLTDTLKAKDLVMLSLDELMHVEVKSASLTGIERIKTPGSVTIISKEEIQLTPYRNLLDLLEVYTPGGSFVNHWLGPRIGMRGVMSDQNNSFLLIVNGEQMNLQYENGPFFEITNRDLSDIEKIEIISGPGSVTYGPGAIGGVISITTKDALNTKKATIGIKHDLTYRYSIINGSISAKKENFSALLSGSISKSEGIKDPKFYYIDRAHGYGYGYMSETWGNKGLGTQAPNFYADFRNKPEVKVQLDIDFFNEFEFWARYTSFSFIKQQQETSAQEGPVFPGYYGQQFTSSIRKNHLFSEKIQLQSSAGFQSQSIGDIQLYQGANKPFDDITQRNNSFSENKINFRSLLSYQATDKFKMAAGIEYNYWFYRSEWGKAENTFIMNFAPPVNFAVLKSSSGFYSQYNEFGIVTLEESPINAHQFSGFYELNYLPAKNTTILFSGRIDKHNLTKVAFSPRVAIIQEINRNNFLKMIAQQSVRLLNFRELYALNFASETSPSPEIHKGIELIYSSIFGRNFSANISMFYQSVNQVGWTDNDRSEVIGEFNTAGFETELSYKLDNFNITFNYSYIKQLKWNPEYEFNSHLSNIGLDSLDIPLLNAGINRINNFPQHQLKLVTFYKINKSFDIHLNARFASKYGQVDMLNMYKTVHDNYGDTRTQQEMSNIYDDARGKGYSMPSFTSNISASYNFNISKINLVLNTWIMNLVSVNQIRYVYQFWEEGNNRQYPRQVGFVKEPRTLGIRLTADF